MSKELANLIFPNAKDISFYEEKYPRRDLQEGAKVVRIAPSPTGFVHIGALFQSIVNFMVARQSNGVYMLRIEDTDQKRTIENGVVEIINAFKDFNVEFNEGMINETDSNGPYGPYRQSQRKEMYDAFAKHLIEIGRAYPCFMAAEELEEMRAKQEVAKLRTGYYGVWAKYRELPLEEAIQRVNNKEDYVLRFKSEGMEEKKIKHQDVIKGNIEFPENDQDIVIIKKDGLPTYHFAHLVDDYLMRTNLVIRADEWLSSVPLHIELFKAFGFKAPKYAHTAAIMKDDNGSKRKISKRKDPEAAVSYYHEQGIPAEAVFEYLLNIANSSFENWRRANKDADMLDFKFELNKMSVSGAFFDMIKLQDVSKNVISKFDKEKVYEESLKYAKRYDEEFAKLLEDNKEYAIQIFGIERGNQKPRKDIAKWSEIKDSILYMFDNEFLNENKEYNYANINKKEDIEKIVKLYQEKYINLEDKQVWFNNIKDLAGELGYAKEVKEYKLNPENYPGHVGDVSTVIRVALTGRQNTPDLFEVMKVLGKDSIEKRLNKVIK